MRKLIIASVIVCTAAFSHAATINWQFSMGQSIYLPGSTTSTLTSGTAYLYDVATISQADMLKAFLGKDGVDFSKAVANTSVTSSGGLTAKPITSGFVGDTVSSYYYIVINGDNLFISDPKTSFTNPSGDKSTPLQMTATTASQAALNTTRTYSGAGWYSAVPEPTSGLLLILGMAGLALRRRRA